MKVLKWFGIILGCLLLVGVAGVLIINVFLFRAIQSGHYTNRAHHYALDIPTGFAARDAAGKGLIIGKSSPPTDSELASHRAAVLAVIAADGKNTQSAEQLKTIEPLVIKQQDSKGNRLVSQTTAPDGGHILVFSYPASTDSRSYSGSYTLPGTATTVFFSVSLPLASQEDQQFLDIAKTIRYVP